MDTIHWFWAGLTGAALLWYSTVTVYVAVKGAANIWDMLARLSKENEEG